MKTNSLWYFHNSLVYIRYGCGYAEPLAEDRWLCAAVCARVFIRYAPQTLHHQRMSLALSVNVVRHGSLWAHYICYDASRRTGRIWLRSPHQRRYTIGRDPFGGLPSRPRAYEAICNCDCTRIVIMWAYSQRQFAQICARACVDRGENWSSVSRSCIYYTYFIYLIELNRRRGIYNAAYITAMGRDIAWFTNTAHRLLSWSKRGFI